MTAIFEVLNNYKNNNMNIIKFFSLVLVLSVGIFNSNVQAQTNSDVTVIELTQTVGQFDTQNLDLKPGKYQFRIVNKNVDKEVGFLIQTKADAKKDPMKTAVPNSFATAMVKKGTAEYTGVVELKSGEYVYSCPLNPTPHYSITVK